MVDLRVFALADTPSASTHVKVIRAVAHQDLRVIELPSLAIVDQRVIGWAFGDSGRARRHEPALQEGAWMALGVQEGAFPLHAGAS